MKWWWALPLAGVAGRASPRQDRIRARARPRSRSPDAKAEHPTPAVPGETEATCADLGRVLSGNCWHPFWRAYSAAAYPRRGLQRRQLVPSWTLRQLHVLRKLPKPNSSARRFFWRGGAGCGTGGWRSAISLPDSVRPPAEDLVTAGSRSHASRQPRVPEEAFTVRAALRCRSGTRAPAPALAVIEQKYTPHAARSQRAGLPSRRRPSASTRAGARLHAVADSA
jgi:hypothetical protein